MTVDDDGNGNSIAATAKGACRACGGLHSIVTRPLVGNVDTIHLFLTLGVVLVSILIWTRILAHMKALGV